MIGQEFRWVIPPSVMQANLLEYRDRVLQGMFQLADMFAQKMEGYAKSNAQWTDRTGAARQGLRGFAQKAALSVTIYLVHSVFYGVFLELGTRYMAPRAIIMPTLEAHYGKIMAAFRALLSGA